MKVNRSLPVLLVLSLAGCASQPDYAPFTGIPRGSAIHVQPFSGVTDSGPPASKVGERAFEGGGIGAAAGVQTGLQMGMEMTGDCGEFVVVCLAMVPVMGVAGLVGGVIVGSVVGLAEDLPYQSTEAMQQVISGYFEAEPPNQAFSEQFVEIAGGDWRLDPSAGNRITVAVISLRPKRESGRTLVFEITTAMTVNYGSDDVPGTKPYQFTDVTAAFGIDEWIYGGHELYGREVEKILTKAATVFTALLKDPPRRRSR